MTLHIYDPRERTLVRTADAGLSAAMAIARPLRRPRPVAQPRRILLLRLERIGDLLMAAPAIADVRANAPDAEIDLIVGSWNAGIARALPGVTRIETLDASWLTRDGQGRGLPALLLTALRWRKRRYDLAINFEPDIRSNLMAALAGAGRTAGFQGGGGGPVLDLAIDFDPGSHTADNARQLVAHVFGRPPGVVPHPLLCVPENARITAARRLPSGRRLVGIHTSGGRAVKQWPPERFADVAARLIAERGTTIVLTGQTTDRVMVDLVKRTLPVRSVVDLSGELDLLGLAAILARLDLLITGDTGPMHLAAAVGTPVVAVFGPSDPARYAPRGPHDRVVRVDLPCAPCNRIRLPPARCTGHTPDCLSLVPSARVYDAAASVLDSTAPRMADVSGHLTA